MAKNHKKHKIAFVYHYWNIETLKSYYGYKESWNSHIYSPFDIFVPHPLGEKSTNIHYCSSCKQKEWKQDCKDGKIYGEIIVVFTGENAGELAHEYEHQMIINHKALYGQEALYNRNDGYAKFSTAGKPCSDKAKENLRTKFKGRKLSKEWREKISVSLTNHECSIETRNKISIKNKGK